MAYDRMRCGGLERGANARACVVERIGDLDGDLSVLQSARFSADSLSRACPGALHAMNCTSGSSTYVVRTMWGGSVPTLCAPQMKSIDRMAIAGAVHGRTSGTCETA